MNKKNLQSEPNLD